MPCTQAFRGPARRWREPSRDTREKLSGKERVEVRLEFICPAHLPPAAAPGVGQQVSCSSLTRVDCHAKLINLHSGINPSFQEAREQAHWSLGQYVQPSPTEVQTSGQFSLHPWPKYKHSPKLNIVRICCLLSNSSIVLAQDIGKATKLMLVRQCSPGLGRAVWEPGVASWSLCSQRLCTCPSC